MNCKFKNWIKRKIDNRITLTVKHKIHWNNIYIEIVNIGILKSINILEYSIKFEINLNR